MKNKKISPIRYLFLDEVDWFDLLRFSSFLSLVELWSGIEVSVCCRFLKNRFGFPFTIFSNMSSLDVICFVAIAVSSIINSLLIAWQSSKILWEKFKWPRFKFCKNSTWNGLTYISCGYFWTWLINIVSLGFDLSPLPQCVLILIYFISLKMNFSLKV